MLEYNLDDAETLLRKNQEAACKSLKQVEEELSYITEQTTTLEVSILFLFLWTLNKGLFYYTPVELKVLCREWGLLV